MDKAIENFLKVIVRVASASYGELYDNPTMHLA